MPYEAAEYRRGTGGGESGFDVLLGRRHVIPETNLFSHSVAVILTHVGRGLKPI